MFDFILHSATLGAALLASSSKDFRAGEVQFLFRLFWNWQSAVQKRSDLEPLHLTQVTRFLNKLKAEAWVVKSKRLRWTLTNAGLIGLLSSLRNRALQGDSRQTDFFIYFVSAYQNQILQLYETNASSKSQALLLEIKSELNLKTLCSEKMTLVKSEISYWQTRIDDTKKAIEFAEGELQKNTDWSEVIKQFEHFFPYEMNAEKPLQDLFEKIPKSWQQWEILNGNQLRMSQLWLNHIGALEKEIETLQKIKF